MEYEAAEKLQAARLRAACSLLASTRRVPTQRERSAAERSEQAGAQTPFGMRGVLADSLVTEQFEAAIGAAMRDAGPTLLTEGPPHLAPVDVTKLPVVIFSTPAELRGRSCTAASTVGSADAELDAKLACPICMQPYRRGELLKALPCGGAHFFHPTCIARWLQGRRTCPMCRDDVGPRPAHVRGAGAPHDPLSLGLGAHRQLNRLLHGVEGTRTGEGEGVGAGSQRRRGGRRGHRRSSES